MFELVRSKCFPAFLVANKPMLRRRKFHFCWKTFEKLKQATFLERPFISEMLAQANRKKKNGLLTKASFHRICIISVSANVKLFKTKVLQKEVQRGGGGGKRKQFNLSEKAIKYASRSQSGAILFFLVTIFSKSSSPSASRRRRLSIIEENFLSLEQPLLQFDSVHVFTAFAGTLQQEEGKRREKNMHLRVLRFL